jgi:hypothetical protein
MDIGDGVAGLVMALDAGWAGTSGSILIAHSLGRLNSILWDWYGVV